MGRFAVVAAGWLLTRLVLLLLFDPLTDAGAGDSAYYLEVARSIAAGQGHSLSGVPTAFRAPAYPVFLAMQGAALPQMAFCIQSIAILGVAWVTLRRLPGGIGFAAALLIVTSPFLVAFEWKLLAETLLVCTL